MVKKEVESLINEQLEKENYSAHLYLAMATWFSEKGLTGYFKYYYTQYQEELDHFRILYHYLLTAGGNPVIPKMDKPKCEFKDVRDILEQTLQHERYITASIEKISTVAREVKDYKSVSLLDWFIDEQVEEEDNSTTALDRYDLFGDTPQGLYSLDAEMGARTYTKSQKLVEMEA